MLCMLSCGLWTSEPADYTVDWTVDCRQADWWTGGLNCEPVDQWARLLTGGLWIVEWTGDQWNELLTVDHGLKWSAGDCEVL